MRYFWLRLALVAVVVGCSPSQSCAFYWVGWPGANPVRPPTVIVTEPQPEHPRPPTSEPPPPPEPPEDPPKNVPEPATISLVGIIGLGVLTARWWKKRMK